MAAIYQFHFLCFEPYNPYYLLNYTRETRFQQYVFISWYHFLYFDEPKHQNSRWPPAGILKNNSKENSPGNRYNITFPINYCTQSPFLKSFVYFDRSECQNSRWSPSVISIVFRFKPFDPLILLNVTSEIRFKQYLLILCTAFAHISTMITKKSRDR